MKKNKKLIFIFLSLFAGGLIFFLQQSTTTKNKENRQTLKTPQLKNKQKSDLTVQEKSSDHPVHEKSNDEAMNHEALTNQNISQLLTRKFKKQINHYESRYLKFLSPTIKKEITVKKELSTKLILLVKTLDKNSLAQSFEAIVDKKSGKLIVNQGFTINENVKLPRFSPSGEKINP